MSNRDRKLAYFYNFKDEETCPFCRIVKDIFDDGGSNFVAEKLGLILENGFRHGFLDCFVHQYWLDEMYNGKVKRTLDIIVKEAYQVFHGMRSMLQMV